MKRYVVLSHTFWSCERSGQASPVPEHSSSSVISNTGHNLGHFYHLWFPYWTNKYYVGQTCFKVHELGQTRARCGPDVIYLTWWCTECAQAPKRNKIWAMWLSLSRNTHLESVLSVQAIWARFGSNILCYLGWLGTSLCTEHGFCIICWKMNIHGKDSGCFWNPIQCPLASVHTIKFTVRLKNWSGSYC